MVSLHSRIVTILLGLLLLSALSLASCDDLGSTPTTFGTTAPPPTLEEATTTEPPSEVPTSSVSTSSGGRLRVPPLVGMDIAAAQDELAGLGLLCELHWVPDFVSSGFVAAQYPAAGTRVSPGSTVTIDGQRFAYQLSDLVGMTEEQAIEYCASTHIHGVFLYEPGPGVAGLVVAQDPGPGTVVMEDLDTVTITVRVVLLIFGQ